jgi:hypothetical protein
MAKLGQDDFDWRISAAGFEPEDVILGAFSGASSGFGMGTSIYDFSQKFGGVNSFRGVGYGQAGRGYTMNGMSTDWRIR